MCHGAFTPPARIVMCRFHPLLAENAFQWPLLGGHVDLMALLLSAGPRKGNARREVDGYCTNWHCFSSLLRGLQRLSEVFRSS